MSKQLAALATAKPGRKAGVRSDRVRAQTRERVRRHRERQRSTDNTAPRMVPVEASDAAALDQALQIRALWSSEPYDLAEYVQTLIVRDHQRLQQQLAAMPACKKCGRRLPDSCERVHKGEADCLLTTAARELAL